MKKKLNLRDLTRDNERNLLNEVVIFVSVGFTFVVIGILLLDYLGQRYNF